MQLRIPSEHAVLTWMIIGGLSAWGGIVRYLMDMRRNNDTWSWTDILSQVVISCFTGLLGGLIGFESGASHYMTYIISGLCGSLGSTALNWMWRRVMGVFSPGEKHE